MITINTYKLRGIREAALEAQPKAEGQWQVAYEAGDSVPAEEVAAKRALADDLHQVAVDCSDLILEERVGVAIPDETVESIVSRLNTILSQL